MKFLFNRCLNASYTHTAENGDYAIEVGGNTLYILFEWSDGAEDWKNNFDFPAIPYKHMAETWFCHRGFLRVWKAMRDEVEKRVAEILAQHPEITDFKIVGYSHGGAMALLATEDMVYLYGEKINVSGYGFGAPRVLWGYVPKAVKNRLQHFYVIRNNKDIVTHVPPALFGFRHVSEVVKIGQTNPVKDHYPEKYTHNLTEVPKTE